MSAARARGSELRNRSQRRIGSTVRGVDAGSLRARLAAKLEFAVAEHACMELDDAYPRNGYAEHPARLLVNGGRAPACCCRRGVRVAAGWSSTISMRRSGTSEVGGRRAHRRPVAGIRTGAGAARHHCIGDRRPGLRGSPKRRPGADARDADESDYPSMLVYRLVAGRPLMRTVLAEAATAHTAVAALP